ncbi:M20/M25/M40 family metallo-hydrolase [Mucilaginibacter daejeonensis]|uniref:M20/M25/M40 family metallo-hydrolase n=1 Tax=Mucilaginibacter daejeonensis TaxID=398049 RepID=UPI001D17358F|nr:M20/M25/M40 family metallo-hydrolase [Mucilaginibacter daejeonensis]UEG53742.1 M20/M25/M40 family metallo-hydrolase [Mucilaginibacter daejeonensis]
MKFQIIALALAAATGISASTYAQNNDPEMLRKLYDEALVNGQCYQNLRYLCKTIGPRLSGSAGAARSVEWGKKLMESYGFDKVYLQEVMVPHWERGAKEQGVIVNGTTRTPVALAALGMSVATPKAGITAEMIELHSLKELETLGEAGIKGKIVFFNRPFDNRFIETGSAYGTAGDQRNAGPGAASKYGAAAVIVRSLTAALDDYPHTGATNYGTNKPIPAAAISTMAANKLSAMLKQKNGKPVKFFLKTNCQTLPDVLSYNVIGEIKGTANNNKYITVGGHLDSWDLAEGAHDDGTGVMQSVEVLRIFKAVGYKPKNNVRAVFFMNEENGHKGGIKYAEQAKANNEEHIAAIETDEGGFTPRGFSFEGASPEFLAGVNQKWKKLLEPYEVDRLVAGGGGTDIGPLKETQPGIKLIGFRPDSQRYFDIHHTPNDVFENVNKRELELGAASIASLVYLIDQYGLSL